MKDSVVASRLVWLLAASLSLLCVVIASRYLIHKSSDLPQQSASVELDTKLDTEASPVPILTELDPEMFPSAWRGPPINTSAELISDQEKKRGVRQVRRAMAMYPANLLEKNLDRVYLVGELRFYNISAGGTNSFDRIYQCVQSETIGFTNEYLRRAFHHELSSIFLRNHGTRQLQTDWENVNPDQFVYLGNGTQAVASGLASEKYNPALAVDGFFSRYAMASYEEDFNTIAAVLFCGDAKLWEAVERFPAIEKKVQLMMAFYERLDPKFTESYFKNLR